jgi:hypothetical protein
LVALDLPVALGHAWWDPAVLDAVRGEQFGERAVVDVAEVVVGLQALGADAVRGEERQRTLDEGGDGGGLSSGQISV